MNRCCFLTPAKVPVEVIVVPNVDVAGLDPADYEVIGEKVSHRLAQRLGSYVILKYVRPLIKLRATPVSLIEPIFDAQLDSIRLSRVIAMDETPIKAGRAGPGKMKAAYFWPVVGEQDEICFLYYPSRAAKHIEDALGLTRPNGAVLQSDGYSADAHYAKKTGITHAQCWAHSRRKISR